VSDVQPERLRTVLAREVNAQAEATLMSTAERIEKEAHERGRREGLMSLLERQLMARFGAVPDHLAQRVRAASIADLERWADAVLFADTIDGVFDRD
jgi:hypothetical protein